MQPITIATPVHQAAGKFIHNNNLSVCDDIVFVPFHQIVGSQRVLHFLFNDTSVLSLICFQDLFIFHFFVDDIFFPIKTFLSQ